MVSPVQVRVPPLKWPANCNASLQYSFALDPFQPTFSQRVVSDALGDAQSPMSPRTHGSQNASSVSTGIDARAEVAGSSNRPSPSLAVGGVDPFLAQCAISIAVPLVCNTDSNGCKAVIHQRDQRGPAGR